MTSKITGPAIMQYGRIIKAFIVLILLISGLDPANAQQPAGKVKPGVFYAITQKGSKDTSYLFGTYHLVKSSYLNLLPHVKQALQNSRGIVTEIVIDSAKLQKVQAMGLLKDKTLSGMLNKSFSDSLDAELKQNLGVGLTQIDQLKPVNVTLALAMVYLIKNNKAKLDQYTGQPLDIYFADFGKANRQILSPLESVEEQMDLLFNRTSEEKQVNELRSFLKNKSEMVALGDKMMAAWFDNDLDRMEALYKETFALSGEADYLLKDRNMKWMTVLPTLLKSNRQFIGVGALHLAGEYGLVALLRKQGFIVTPLML